MARINQRLNGLNPLSYIGDNAAQPTDFITRPVDPTTSDSRNFYLGTWWLNIISLDLFYLASLNGGIATWLLVGTGNSILSLTGNSGGPVFADVNRNINVIGDAVTIDISGNPGTNTLTVSAIGSGVVSTLTGNSGGPVSPLAGNIDVVGDSLTIDIVGNPGTHTLTVSTVGTGVLSTLTGNDGVPVSPLNGNIDVVTDNATVEFLSGTPNTLTLDFGLSNLLLGSPGSITSGGGNAAYGQDAASSVTTGSLNTFLSYNSGLNYTTGDNSTAVGSFSMNDAVAGADENTAIGASSLTNLAGVGVGNIAIGFSSASAYTTTESDNIIIGNAGVVGESNTTRIGSVATRTFIDGIDGVNVGSTAKVVTMGTAGTVDQLGTATITAGTGISVTPGANTITITNTGASVTGASSFFAYQSFSPTNNVTGDGTVYQVPFDTEVFDVNNDYNVGTGIFTAPVTGYYYFSVRTLFENIAATMSQGLIQLVVTGTSANTYVGDNLNPGAVGENFAALQPRAYPFAVATLLKMTAGDTIYPEVIINGPGGTLTVGYYGSGGGTDFRSYFSGFLVSI